MSPDSLFLLTPVLPFQSFLFLIFFISLFSFWLTPGGLAWALSRARGRTRAIPGPSGLPLLGLTLSFTNKLTHQILSQLSTSFKATSLMAFSVGFTRFIISSTPDTAKLILNSSAFADRPVKESAYSLMFHRAMGFAPYGEYWRGLRKLSATHLFSSVKVSHFGGFRREMGLRIVEEIRARMQAKNEVEIRKILHFGSLNNVMMTVFGKWYDFNQGDGDGVILEGLVKEGYELLGMFNWSDHFPLLGWMDLQGVRKRSKKLVGQVNAFVGKIIKEHKLRRDQNHQEHSHDFVDVLLDLDMDNKLSHSDMIAILWNSNAKADDTTNNNAVAGAVAASDGEQNPSTNGGDGVVNCRRRTPFTDLSQVDADLALARTLQEQSYGHEGEFDDASEEDYEGSDVEVDDEAEDAFDVHARANEVENDNQISHLDLSAFSNDKAYARALQDAEEQEMTTRMLALAGINGTIVGEDEDEEDEDHDGCMRRG